MTRRLRPLALTAVLALAASGCAAFGDDTGASDDGSTTVAAAFYPLAFVSERVAGEHADVELLTQPGGEAHDLELGVGETAVLAEADLVVYEAGFQPAVDDALEQNASGAALEAGEVVGLQPFAETEHAEEEADHAEEEAAHAEEEEGHSEGDGHDHEGGLDPHFWLDPMRMAELGDAVADRLAEIDPDHADDFRSNAEALRTDLAALDTRFAETLATCERDIIVVSHDAFGYLAKYGVEVAPVAGLSPDAEPTAAGLAELQELIEAEQVTTVFNERLASTQFTDSLARDAGVETAVLDPIEGLTDETAGDDYLSLMEQNLDALASANACT